MPATLTADSSATTQLLFDFESSYALPRVERRREVVKHQPRQTRGESLRRQSAMGVLPSRTTVQPAAVAEPHRRGAGEIRIGAVMLQLLKRYGITDEEIEEGLAEYARTHGVCVAVR